MWGNPCEEIHLDYPLCNYCDMVIFSTHEIGDSMNYFTHCFSMVKNYEFCPLYDKKRDFGLLKLIICRLFDLYDS